MHYLKIIIFTLSFLLIGCGKSPLFNKLKKDVSEITGSEPLGERFPNGNQSFIFNWTVGPNLTELSAFELIFDLPLKDGQTLNAYLWMPEMGHGSSPIEIKPLGATTYAFSELAFIMPGLWVIHIEIIENNKVVDEWKKFITL